MDNSTFDIAKEIKQEIKDLTYRISEIDHIIATKAKNYQSSFIVFKGAGEQLIFDLKDTQNTFDNFLVTVRGDLANKLTQKENDFASLNT